MAECPNCKRKLRQYGSGKGWTWRCAKCKFTIKKSWQQMIEDGTVQGKIDALAADEAALREKYLPS